MLTINEMTAISFRIFLNLLMPNLHLVNKRITDAIENFKKADSHNPEFPCHVKWVFERPGLNVEVVSIKGVAYLHVHCKVANEPGTWDVHSIKLGKAGSAPINKRVINELNVLFHREYRDAIVLGRGVLDTFLEVAGVYRVGIFPAGFRFMDKVLGRSRRNKITTATELDSFISCEVVGSKNIFGTLNVRVEIGTPPCRPDCLMHSMSAPFFGVIRDFTFHPKEKAHGSLRSVLTAHIKANL